MTIESIWEFATRNSFWGALAAIGFFTAKGILWLAIPYLIVRLRKLIAKQSRVVSLPTKR